MQQYYTSIEVDNNGYIGVVYNTTNNGVEYRTNPHTSQLQAVMDVTNFLKTKKPSSTQNNPNIILNTAQLNPVPQPGKRCCGR
jgi:hypothetical protein